MSFYTSEISIKAVFGNYFALKYPKAWIISLEPEKTNFNILIKSSKKYKNICCLNKALGYTKKSLYKKSRSK
jgi:hypothetical protein